MFKDKATSQGTLLAASHAVSKPVVRTEREVITIDVLQQLNNNLKNLEELNNRLGFMLSEVKTLTQRFSR